jgi:hypothetical protein
LVPTERSFPEGVLFLKVEAAHRHDGTARGKVHWGWVSAVIWAMNRLAENQSTREIEYGNTQANRFGTNIAVPCETPYVYVVGGGTLLDAKTTIVILVEDDR